jgi:hypothetical protein
MKPDVEFGGEECQRGPAPPEPEVSKARPAIVIQTWPALP